MTQQAIPPHTWTLLDQDVYSNRAWVYLDSNTANTVTFLSHTNIQFPQLADTDQWTYTTEDPTGH